MTPEQERWNEKYSRRGPNLFQPEDFLVKRQHFLRPGTVLDVGCGDGRHAIYLARKGFAVTGIDFSTEGLRRLAHFAEQEDLLVNTYQRDLREEGMLSDLGPFDNIIVIHFKPLLHTFQEMCEVLRPNGILLMTSFNVMQHAERNFPEEYCYREREFVHVNESIELIEYVSYEQSCNEVI
ncbi:class I SAM-dependent methyltransferase [Alicyclobacillus herbarius]|uniref:class I SAM-dependent methyltransferase n=1 Tax=Alicyclobacillus herbarius TaxID=122960 RepID=UPI000422285F|nr:class I SAM-dependent methyltransferase [Alicyclobacillus herbarius]